MRAAGGAWVVRSIRLGLWRELRGSAVAEGSECGVERPKGREVEGAAK